MWSTYTYEQAKYLYSDDFAILLLKDFSRRVIENHIEISKRSAILSRIRVTAMLVSNLYTQRENLRTSISMRLSHIKITLSPNKLYDG